MNFNDVFHDSYRRAVVLKPDAFFDQVHTRFIDKIAALNPAFNQSPIQIQKDLLVNSMITMLWFAEARTSDEQLEELIQTHRQMGIAGDLYDHWMDAILESLNTVDPTHSVYESLAWRIMLSPALTLMKHSSVD